MCTSFFSIRKTPLLLGANDLTTTTKEGTYHGRFWFPIGGQNEPGETLHQTALREIYEETGLTPSDIELGPVFWYGEFDFILSGAPTHCKQQFIVARTQNKEVHLSNLTSEDKVSLIRSAGLLSSRSNKAKRLFIPLY